MQETQQEDDIYSKIIQQIANADIELSPVRETVTPELQSATTRSTISRSKSPIATAKIKQEKLKNIMQQKAVVI